MPKNILVHSVAGAPTGFVVAIVLFVVAILPLGVIAVTLGQITSFGDIAWQSFLSFLAGFAAAGISLRTSRLLAKLKDLQFPQDSIHGRRLPTP